VAEKKFKHHVIHVEEKADGTGGKIHGFPSSKLTAEIVEKLARLQNNRRKSIAVKKLVDTLLNKQKGTSSVRNQRGGFAEK